MLYSSMFSHPAILYVYHMQDEAWLSKTVKLVAITALSITPAVFAIKSLDTDVPALIDLVRWSHIVGGCACGFVAALRMTYLVWKCITCSCIMGR